LHCGGTVTPILYGRPWLEKPALYYWRAMSFFREFGVSDWSARLPSATGAFLLIVMIFLHMRRFRPGGQLDAALITASCVAIVGIRAGGVDGHAAGGAVLHWDAGVVCVV
jgi:4-amino-4-deoxy-L-arabinose transferase-like glycosyltransferase